MPAPGALILLAAVSASGCLASPAHPGESVRPSACPAAPTPTAASLPARGLSAGLRPQHLCASLQPNWAWNCRADGVSVNRAWGRQAGGWGAGKDGGSGRIGAEGTNTISKADTTPEAVSGFGEDPGLAEFPSRGFGLGLEDKSVLQASLKETGLSPLDRGGGCSEWGKNLPPACS
ncbi:hypothetical protein GHT09_008359 [Marmota monax]|uniref:Uncharacterized protein n=1 Tax=Marmota monax TaxID=9995 RepID=A0A834V1H7_MARMO|nr:hypothetical protein GHT09_008359 [Marmota monax]